MLVVLEFLWEKFFSFIEVLRVLVYLGNGVRQVHGLLVEGKLHLAEAPFNDSIPGLFSTIGNVSVEYQGVRVGL